jgi:hypothetical protein
VNKEAQQYSLPTYVWVAAFPDDIERGPVSIQIRWFGSGDGTRFTGASLACRHYEFTHIRSLTDKFSIGGGIKEADSAEVCQWIKGIVVPLQESIQHLHDPRDHRCLVRLS